MMPTQDPLDVAATTPPWWVKPLYVFGVPAGIAIFLVVFMAFVVASGQAEVRKLLEAHVWEGTVNQQHQLLLLERICRNTAQTDRERDQCQVARR